MSECGPVQLLLLLLLPLLLLLLLLLEEEEEEEKKEEEEEEAHWLERLVEQHYSAQSQTEQTATGEQSTLQMWREHCASSSPG